MGRSFLTEDHECDYFFNDHLACLDHDLIFLFVFTYQMPEKSPSIIHFR